MNISKTAILILAFAAISYALQASAAEAPSVDRATQQIDSQASIQRDLGRIDEAIRSSTQKLEKVADKQGEMEKSLLEAKTNLIIAATLLGIGIAAVITFSRNYIKKKINNITKVTEESLTQLQDERLSRLEELINQRLIAVDATVKEAIGKAVYETEEKSFQYMQIVSLRNAQRFDEALTFIGWAGDYREFVGLPEPVQRNLIACLTKSHKVRENGDNIKAWEWAIHLMRKSPTADNIEGMLRTGKELSHTADAIELYDSYAQHLSPSEQARCEQFLIVILRKATSSSILKSRLYQLAEKHRHSKDIRTQTTIAAVYRDEGLFEEADAIMRPNVKAFTGLTPTQDGWDKLFNTYIANCIDLDKPAEAVQQVRTLLASHHRPDHVFNCARVAWRLPDDGLSARTELFTLIKRRFDDGLMPERDDGTIKTMALLKELAGERDQAEAVLSKAIDSMANHGGSAWARSHAYFYRCAMAELLLGRRDDRELDRVISILNEISTRDPNGEASYLLAQAMARKGEETAALKALDAAAKIKKKWIKKAIRERDFARLNTFDSLVSNHTVPLPLR